MTDFIALAARVHADASLPVLQRLQALQRSRNERFAATDTALVRKWGPVASQGLARILGANPEQPEFRDLRWRADGVHAFDPPRRRLVRRTPTIYLTTAFQDVPIRARIEPGSRFGRPADAAFHVYANDWVHLFTDLHSLGAAIAAMPRTRFVWFDGRTATCPPHARPGHNQPKAPHERHRLGRSTI